MGWCCRARGWGVVAALVAVALAVAPAAATTDSTVATGTEALRTIAAVEFDGVQQIPLAALRQARSLPIPLDSLEAALRAWGQVYYRNGFLEARLVPDTRDLPRLRVQVEEGAPARLAHVFVRGPSRVPKSVIRDRLDLDPGEPFRPARVESAMTRLLDAYADRGHLFATAALERLEFTPEGVVLGIVISEGEPVHLAEVRFAGNHTTREALLRRIAGLRPGDLADRAHLEQAAPLLRRSGFFSRVGNPRLFRTPGASGALGVWIDVEEVARRNTVFGSVGVARDPRDASAYLSGALDLRLQNIWGTGRDVDLAWKRDALAGSHLELSFRERYPWGLPLDLRLDARQTVRDSTYTFQSAGVAVQLPLSRSLALELGTAFDRSVFHVGLQGNARRLRQRIGLVFESLAREADGRRFGTLEVRAEYARKSNALQRGTEEDRSKVRQTLWNGRFDAGVPLASRHVVGVRGAWHVIESNEAEIVDSEQYYFGGARTLRGYREDQFRGDQVAYGSLEYRFGDPHSGRLYAFVDAGALRRKQAGGDFVSATHVGYGVGLRGAMATGIFDLSFGIGEERSFSGTKVHVSLLQRF